MDHLSSQFMYRFNHAKQDFKKSICRQVDDLFESFLVELRSSPSIITTASAGGGKVTSTPVGKAKPPPASTSTLLSSLLTTSPAINGGGSSGGKGHSKGQRLHGTNNRNSGAAFNNYSYGHYPNDLENDVNFTPTSYNVPPVEVIIKEEDPEEEEEDDDELEEDRFEAFDLNGSEDIEDEVQQPPCDCADCFPPEESGDDGQEGGAASGGHGEGQEDGEDNEEEVNKAPAPAQQSQQPTQQLRIDLRRRNRVVPAAPRVTVTSKSQQSWNSPSKRRLKHTKRSQPQSIPKLKLRRTLPGDASRGQQQSSSAAGGSSKVNFTIYGNRPHFCSFPGCDKAFPTTQRLTTHLRIHQGVRPYSCKWPGCSYRSVQEAHMCRHIRIRHFRLPETMKRQQELGIEDDRNPREFIEVHSEML